MTDESSHRDAAADDERQDDMSNVTDATKLPPHGLFYMENAGGYRQERASPIAPSLGADEHQPGCFALEEERGEDWKGTGASGPVLKEARPSL